MYVTILGSLHTPTVYEELGFISEIGAVVEKIIKISFEVFLFRSLVSKLDKPWMWVELRNLRRSHRRYFKRFNTDKCWNDYQTSTYDDHSAIGLIVVTD